MLSETEPKTALGLIIEELSQKLLDYSKSSSPNEAYITRQKALITRLYDIHNTQEHITHYSFLQTIDQQLGKLLAENPEVDGVIISLYLKPNPRNISLIALTCP